MRLSCKFRAFPRKCLSLNGGPSVTLSFNSISVRPPDKYVRRNPHESGKTYLHGASRSDSEIIPANDAPSP